MNKSKGIKSILFVAGLTFGIALLLIDSHTSISSVFESDLLQKKSQSFKTSEKDNENPENTSFNSGQSFDDSYITYTDEERALLIEQNNKEQYIASRGTPNRNTNTVASAETKTGTPAETTASAKQTTPAAPASPAQVKSVSSTEVKPDAQTNVQPAASETKPAAQTNDLDLLARLITAEAQGEPYEAKVAVGAVVINRVESSSWPNTMKEVIYQNINGYYQFTPVVNGWINKPAEPGSIEAAKAALSGVDPTNGAQFYYDDTTTNPWILSKPVSIKIGHMIFAL